MAKAKRCIFTVKEDKIVVTPITIEWSLGFTRAAKRQYIQQVYAEAKLRQIDSIIDVTSANDGSQKGYLLSPIFIPFDEKSSIEDNWKKIADGITNKEVRQALFCLVYILRIRELAESGDTKYIDIIKQYDSFTDVFHRPGEGHCTQAKAAAFCKWLLNNDLFYTELDIDRVYELLSKVGFDC